MRSSVVVVSSVNASFNTVGRGVHMDGGESGLYLTNGARPVKAPRRIVNAQNCEEFPRMRRRRKGATGRIPFPRSDTTAGDPSAPTISEGETLQRCSTNTSSSIADAAPQEGSFTRCFSFLKRVGVDLIMPPYTIDEWFNNIVSAQTSLNSSVTKTPIV